MVMIVRTNQDFPCLICRATTSIVLPFVPNARFRSCLSCGFVFQYPRSPEQELLHHYEEDFWNIHGTPAPPSGWKVRSLEVFERVAPLVKPSSRVLEIGCGKGENLACLQAKTGARVFGIEPSRDGAREAQEKYGLDLHSGPLETYSATEPFDLVILSHVLEHLFEPRDALRRIASLLKPSGNVFIEVPDILSLDRRKHLSAGFCKEHLYYFSARSLTSLLSSAGYEVCDVTRQQKAIRAVCRLQPLAYDQPPHELRQVLLSLAAHEIGYASVRLGRRFQRSFG